MIKAVTFTEPNNFRTAKCCGTCVHWEWEYEGDGHCKKFPAYVSAEGESHAIWDGASAVCICDDYDERLQEQESRDG